MGREYVDDAEKRLKGQCHEIFEYRFFHQNTSPGPIRDVLGPFRILANFCGVIRNFNRLPGVQDTGVATPMCPRHRGVANCYPQLIQICPRHRGVNFDFISHIKPL